MIRKEVKTRLKRTGFFNFGANHQSSFLEFHFGPVTFAVPKKMGLI
jgi:hypothetical protein